MEFFKEINWDTLHTTPCPFEDFFDNKSQIQTENRGEIVFSSNLKKVGMMFFKKDLFVTLKNNGEI